MDTAIKNEKSKFKIKNTGMTLVAFIALILAIVSLVVASRPFTTLNSQLSQSLQNQNIEIMQLKQELADLKESQANTAIELTALKTSQNNMSTQITALKAIPTVNNQDQTLYLQLANIDTQIQTLPATVTPPQTLTQQKTQPTTHTWRDSLHDNWESFKGLIIIRHDDSSAPELLSSNQRANVLQNIHVLIAQTQFAVLKHDDAIYHHNLNQTIDWLTRYFDTNQNKTQQVLQSLQDLNKINISPTGSNR